MERPSLLIDVFSIIEDLGQTIEVDTRVTLPTLVVGSEEFVPVEDAALEGTLTNTGAGIVFAGRLSVELHAVCSRCLREFVLPVTVEVDGFYVAHGHEEDLPEEQEVGFVESGSVDVMDAVLSALTLELPFAPVHDEECKGICPTCGADLNEGPCDCAPPLKDSPFAGLKELFPDGESE